ncbi:branched-subunit amino acid aminotransferase/4-amino-4-deoxychorismate lyase [Parvibaculum indicum]|uniref:aminotransferase class IV n=1 Tax=Parvibaculum indicum TaxID=562969 RepID=UPI001423CB04|nr:aminotransferase class IV [Parvibaculum indicum]NIJ41398.1 branched-subunit amino acid aminotransferase/4-amino-4-deoxychorismate lyase [Parvibaculum indicum]
MKLWLNGEIVEAEGAHIAPSDRGFLLGDGLFETLLVLDGRPVLIDAHIARLASAAEILAIPLPFPPAALKAACGELLAANALDNAPRASLRVTLTRGPGPRGIAVPPEVSPTLLIAAAPGAEPPESVRAVISTIRRNASSPAAQLKALPYLDNVFAKEEAKLAGADEAILLDTQGHLACASVGNVFFWEGRTLVTPTTDGPILPGITRASVLALARKLDIETEEGRIAPERLLKAEGIFLTNSLTGLLPVEKMDGRKLPAHPETQRLSDAYEAFIRRP